VMLLCFFFFSEEFGDYCADMNALLRRLVIYFTPRSMYSSCDDVNNDFSLLSITGSPVRLNGSRFTSVHM
jgi:hypothetical protein